MNTQLNYMIAKQQRAKLTCRAERARLVEQARPIRPASSRHHKIGWRLVTRRLSAARVSRRARKATAAPQEGT